MNNYEEPDEVYVIRRSEHRMLLNSTERLRKENEVLRSSLASSDANVADLQADIDNLNAKVKVLKEVLKEIVNG